MLYTNLIYFLVVIFVFSTDSAPASPWLAPSTALSVALFSLIAFSFIAGRVYRRADVRGAAGYFSAEKILSFAAVAVFVFFVYGLDLKYYLQPLSFDGQLPVVVNMLGLAVFFLLLSIVWLRGRRYYEVLFHTSYAPLNFVKVNIKANLPIVLPWLVLSFVFDLMAILPFASFHKILRAPWGDLILFLVFVVFLAIFFPPLVRWLWGCQPMPPGPMRNKIETFCAGQGFSSEILYWPLFEGQVLTAGIMGIVPRFRFLLITPALLAALNSEELDSVLAHEIGHVKKMHLVLYIFLFFGFSLLAGAFAESLPYLILGTGLFYTLLGWFHVQPETLLAILGTAPLLVLMLVYFRFIFGYFIRNFERQADLYVFKAQGTSLPLSSSFEKIALLSGNIRDEKSWHHFGIGERVDFLQRCEEDRTTIRRHDRKVYGSLALYFVVIATVVFAVWRTDFAAMNTDYDLRFTEAVLEQKLRQEPTNSLWLQLLGDLMQRHEMEKKAIAHYEKALALDPMNADVKNNLAWLLLTAQDRSLRDPARALTVARSAIIIKEQGYIFDTLATAFWANGFLEEAIDNEARAAQVDPENRKYYRSQAEKFQNSRWEQAED